MVNIFFLLAGRSGNQKQGSEIFCVFQSGPENHGTSCRRGTSSFPGVKRPERVSDHTLLVPGFEYIEVITLPPFCACTGTPWSDLYLYCHRNFFLYLSTCVMAMYSFRTFENGPWFLPSQRSKFPDPPIPVFLTAFMRYYLAFSLQLKELVLKFMERSES